MLTYQILLQVNEKDKKDKNPSWRPPMGHGTGQGRGTGLGVSKEYTIQNWNPFVPVSSSTLRTSVSGTPILFNQSWHSGYAPKEGTCRPMELPRIAILHVPVYHRDSSHSTPCPRHSHAAVVILSRVR